ncbi:hypothetical protein ACWGNA_02660 [Brucella cytisi]|jgi:hypothetical protein|nr:hypothetical protein [Brucella cytisi]
MRALIPIGQLAELNLETCIERLETENGDVCDQNDAHRIYIAE